MLIKRITIPIFIIPVLISCLSHPPADKNIEDLISRMSLEEKIMLIAGKGMDTLPVNRLGIPGLKMTDGPVGVKFGKGTCFPASISLAASWNPELLGEIGRILAKEARYKGRNMLLGPCINIHRVPMGGRNFESFGEDPYLASRLAVSYINGVQKENIIATPKHFACNNQEWERFSINTIVDERALREIYLPAFEASVKEAGAWSIMAAYNKVNGYYCTENNYLLNRILKNEWNFQGFVVSDWGAVHSTLPAAQNGLDIEMPDQEYFNQNLVKAVKSGRIREKVVDDKVRRILRAMQWAGLLNKNTHSNPGAINTPKHHATALQAALEGMVLLKNENNLLPLDHSSITSVAVIGPNAGKARTGGGGSSEVTPFYAVSPLDGITKSLGETVKINFAQGCTLDKEIEPIPSYAFSCDVNGVKTTGLLGEYFNNINLSGAPDTKRVDKSIHFDWHDASPAFGIHPDNFSVRWKGTIVSQTGGEIELSVTNDDGLRLWFDEKLLVDDWHDHAAETKKVFVLMEPGKEYDIRIEYYERGGWAVATLGWNKPGELLKKALDAARSSEVVVICAGLSRDYESEGFDRSGMELPDNQNELIEKVFAVNKNVIVVLNTGAPITMNPWANKIPAIIQAWYPGQEGGNAIAGVLFGKYNPGGKLPVTFPLSWETSPAYTNYPGSNGKVIYKEGIFIGYRYFDSNNKDILFPFGHGLSYTTFEYKNIKVTPQTITKENLPVLVQVEIQNTGTREGEEVVQLYVHDREAKVKRPFKELKSFKRINLVPAGTKTVAFELDKRAFAFYSVEQNDWVIEPGMFDILIGSSSKDIRLSDSLVFE